MAETANSPYKTHVYVCTNFKEGAKTCGADGASNLRDELKTMAKERWGKQVRVNSAGCLGQCERGIAVTIYPDNKVVTNVKKDDHKLVLDLIETSLSKQA